jgi:small conductance mechanosensitive channel
VNWLLTPSPSPSAPASGDGDVLSAESFQEWLSNLGDGALRFAVVVVVCLLVYLVGRLVIRALTSSVERGLPLSRHARKALKQARIEVPDPDSQDFLLEKERRRQRARTLRAVLNSSLAVLIVATVIASALNILGVPLAPLMASAGVVGVALGFGAQSLVRDVLSGMFMLFEDQYGVGDVVDLGEATGSVEEFGLRATRLRSLDGTVWYVPNGEIRRVGNMTRLWSRALIEVRLAYDTDLAAAHEAFLEAAADAREKSPAVDAAILSGPEIPGVESLDFDAVMMRMMLQVTPGMQWEVMRAIRLELRRTLKAHGVRIAVPRESLFLDDKGRGGTVVSNEDEPL